MCYPRQRIDKWILNSGRSNHNTLLSRFLLQYPRKAQITNT